MPAIKNRLTNSCPELAFAEIHIPDDKDLGTGTFKTSFRPNSLPAEKNEIGAIILFPRVFQISATVSPGQRLTVSVGTAIGEPKHTAMFRMPEDISSQNHHLLEVSFSQWSISSATLDGAALAKTEKV